MSLEKNKAVVMKFLSLSSDGSSINHLLTDDATSWDALRGPAIARETLEMSQNYMKLFKSPVRMDIISVTAEEDRVAVESKSHADLFDGRVYENTYHFLFRLRDGRIFDMREHSNTVVPTKMFGESLVEGVDLTPAE